MKKYFDAIGRMDSSTCIHAGMTGPAIHLYLSNCSCRCQKNETQSEKGKKIFLHDSFKNRQGSWEIKVIGIAHKQDVCKIKLKIVKVFFKADLSQLIIISQWF